MNWASIILFFSLILFVHANEFPYVLFRGRDCGMFSVFNDVLALLKYYDQGRYQGIQIDFGMSGLYFDKARGENWWSYYCEPIAFGMSESPYEVFGDVPFARRREAEWYTTRVEANALIQKYIRFKPHILKAVDEFDQAHFKKHFVIGVHYRGTDKMKEEASAYFFHDLYRFVREKVRDLNRPDYLIFLATDEANVARFFQSLFSGHICLQTNIHRSLSHGDPPPHLDRSIDDPYQIGEEAVIDCLLLSRCDLLIRTSSNLSLWSTFLNPNIPVIELNKRIDDEKPPDYSLEPQIDNCASEAKQNRRGQGPHSERGALTKARATRKIDLAKSQPTGCHLFEARVNK